MVEGDAEMICEGNNSNNVWRKLRRGTGRRDQERREGEDHAVRSVNYLRLKKEVMRLLPAAPFFIFLPFGAFTADCSTGRRGGITSALAMLPYCFTGAEVRSPPPTPALPRAPLSLEDETKSLPPPPLDATAKTFVGRERCGSRPRPNGFGSSFSAFTFSFIANWGDVRSWFAAASHCWSAYSWL